MTARRRFLQGVGAAFLYGAGAHAGSSANAHVEYGQDTLPIGIRSRLIDNGNGANMHILGDCKDAQFNLGHPQCARLRAL
jgi:hypothetical protein